MTLFERGSRYFPELPRICTHDNAGQQKQGAEPRSDPERSLREEASLG